MGAVARGQIAGQMHAGCGVQAQIEASSVAQLSQGKTAGARLARNGNQEMRGGGSGQNLGGTCAWVQVTCGGQWVVGGGWWEH